MDQWFAENLPGFACHGHDRDSITDEDASVNARYIAGAQGPCPCARHMSASSIVTQPYDSSNLTISCHGLAA
jgi:hypothetical protein